MDRLSRMLAAAQSMGGMGGQQGVSPPPSTCAGWSGILVAQRTGLPGSFCFQRHVCESNLADIRRTPT